MVKYYSVIAMLILGSRCLIGNTNKCRPWEKENAQLTQSPRGNGMSFTPNKGQIADRDGNLRPDVLYKGEGSDIYLRKTGISYVFSNMDEVMHKVHEKVEEMEHSKEGLGGKTEGEWEQELIQKESIKVHQIDMDFEGANKNISTTNEYELDGYNNYYYAHCPNGVLNVKQYNKVTYKNIYKNIDVSYYGNNQSGMKYDIIVQPHADPNQIKLHWKGTESIHINREGHLVIKTSVNEFTESIPKVYQVINGEVIDVKAKYVLTPPDGHRVSNGEAIINFSFLIYNSSFPLVIDPWVTYYGGAGDDKGTRITTDASGNVYLAGYTTSTTGIAASGFQNVFGGSISSDAFLVKFNGAGTRLWGTYYGGTGYNQDSGNSVATDTFGNVYLAGYTTSLAGIAAGGFQNVHGGGYYDAFLVKFNSVSGARLWATYYGGTGQDYGNSVTTDALGNVYLAGNTASANGIAFAGFQNTFGGGTNGTGGDAFLVKFNSASGGRLWGTYYGGTGQDNGNSVATDAAGNVYLAGNAPSIAGIASGGFQNTFGGGTDDAFLVKFNSASGGRIWATYYGGTGREDSWNDVATDAAGNVYLAGRTGSTTGIASGGFQNTFGGSTIDAFLVKFNGAGVRLWATYIGGTNYDYAQSVAVDQLTNDVYISGDTYSLNFPVTSCAWQKARGGSEDGFVAHFNSSGQIVCSSYVGGPSTNDDEDCRIALYGCYVYMTGWTYGSYPVTPGAHQTAFGGGTMDAFVAQLYKNSCGFDKTSVLAASANAGTVCNNTPINFTGNFSVSCGNSLVNYTWSFPGGTPAISTSQNPTGIVYTTPGNYTVQLKAKTSCDSSSKNINITISPCTVCNLVGRFTKGTTNCVQCGCKEWILVTATGGTSPYTYLWPDGYDKRYKNQLCPGSYTINIKDKNGCNINVNLSAP